MGSELQAQQRATDCQTQLKFVKQQYHLAVQQINQQLQQQQDALESMKKNYLQAQQDGGATLQSIQQLTMDIQATQGQIAVIQQQIQDAEQKTQELEKKCTQQEILIQHSQASLDSCISQQGFLPKNYQLMAAVILLGTSSILTGLITANIPKK